MMEIEVFRSGLGKLYRGFDRKPPTEEKVESLYRRLRVFHSYAWEKAVSSLLCQSTFPSFADIKLECSEWERRQGSSDDDDTQRRIRELTYLQAQLDSFNSKPESDDSRFAVPYIIQSIDDHRRNPSGKLSDVDDFVSADPHFAELCAMSIAMWTAGGEPEEISAWLESKQDGCIVSLFDQCFAVRGLKKYRNEGLSLYAPRHIPEKFDVPWNENPASLSQSAVSYAQVATPTLPEME